jgi:transcriptional regulator NrdR family protein
MNCPVCGGDTCIVDSRRKADSVKRKRRCLACKYQFCTLEVNADGFDMLTKIDKRAVQEALHDGYEELTKRLCRALEIIERNSYADNQD